ncbi:nuclear transport factor 2 family protein [Streptomyces sp. NPDC006516]|uniref:nuclear transport factor 2 family protein n=1 Tax=Streptomyces sp. NPDC006516 TaxID=3154309 RepID=UPI00339FD184
MTETTGEGGTAWGSRAVRATVEAYWAAVNARDWGALAAMLTDDVVYDLPQSRERVLGKERYVRFSRARPEDRHVRIERIVADGEGGRGGGVAARTTVMAGSQELSAVHFFTFDARGRIAGVTDFWREPYETPAGREHLTERY